MDYKDLPTDTPEPHALDWQPTGIVLVAIIITIVVSVLLYAAILRCTHRRKPPSLPRGYLLPAYIQTHQSHPHPTDHHQDTVPTPAYEVLDPFPGVLAVPRPTATHSRQHSGLRDGLERGSFIFGSVQRRGLEPVLRPAHSGHGSVDTLPAYEAPAPRHWTD